MPSLKCPCCGYLTLTERAAFEICPVCFWEDDGQDDGDAQVARGGPNGSLSLTQARTNFRLFGACDRRYLAFVRPPLPDEAPPEPPLENPWPDFDCVDYCQSPLASTGWWHEPSQCWYIEPASRAYVDTDLQMLVVGRPGVDGLLWGYRRGQRGIWVYYPIEHEYRQVAVTVDGLRDGYATGAIVV